MKYELIQFADATELARDAARRWLEQLFERSGKSDKVAYTVALSGGRITKDFFGEIVKQVGENPGGLGHVFDRVHFFWADERCVPPNDPESNYAMARALLFDPLKIPESQIHRVRGEGPEPTTLKEVTDSICKWVPMSKGQPMLDMIFLGMGENGHVASLFPEEPEEEMKNPAIYRAVTTVKPPPRRITLGYGAIAAAREVWVLVSGKGKEQALKESLSDWGRTPLARVIRWRNWPVRIFTDIDTGLK